MNPWVANILNQISSQVTPNKNAPVGEQGSLSRGASNLMRSIGLGIFPNMAANAVDEAKGVGNIMAGKGKLPININTYNNPLRSYDQASDMYKTNPVISSGEDTAGLASWLLPTIQALKGTGLVSKLGNAAITGGVRGELYGTSQKDPLNPKYPIAGAITQPIVTALGAALSSPDAPPDMTTPHPTEPLTEEEQVSLIQKLGQDPEQRNVLNTALAGGHQFSRSPEPPPSPDTFFTPMEKFDPNVAAQHLNPSTMEGLSKLGYGQEMRNIGDDLGGYLVSHNITPAQFAQHQPELMDLQFQSGAQPITPQSVAQDLAQNGKVDPKGAQVLLNDPGVQKAIQKSPWITPEILNKAVSTGDIRGLLTAIRSKMDIRTWQMLGDLNKADAASAGVNLQSFMK